MHTDVSNRLFGCRRERHRTAAELTELTRKARLGSACSEKAVREHCDAKVNSVLKMMNSVFKLMNSVF